MMGSESLKYNQTKGKPQKGEVGISKKVFFLLLAGLDYFICL